MNYWLVIFSRRCLIIPLFHCQRFRSGSFQQVFTTTLFLLRSWNEKATSLDIRDGIHCKRGFLDGNLNREKFAVNNACKQTGFNRQCMISNWVLKIFRSSISHSSIFKTNKLHYLSRILSASEILTAILRASKIEPCEPTSLAEPNNKTHKTLLER